MGDTGEHEKCHCSHVVVIQTKVTMAQWLIAIVAAGVIGLFISRVGELIQIRVSTAPQSFNKSERLFEDRVEHGVE